MGLTIGGAFQIVKTARYFEPQFLMIRLSRSNPEGCKRGEGKRRGGETSRGRLDEGRLGYNDVGWRVWVELDGKAYNVRARLVVTVSRRKNGRGVGAKNRAQALSRSDILAQPQVRACEVWYVCYAGGSSGGTAHPLVAEGPEAHQEEDLTEVCLKSQIQFGECLFTNANLRQEQGETGCVTGQEKLEQTGTRSGVISARGGRWPRWHYHRRVGQR